MISLLTTGAMLALLGVAVVLVNALTDRRDLQVGRDRNDVRLNPALRRVPWFAAATIASTITPLYAVLTVFGLRETRVGLLVLVSPLTLVVAALAARALSRHLLATNHGAAKAVLSTGLVASLFARPGTHLPASLVRLVGLGNVVAIIWLEVKYLAIYLARYMSPAGVDEGTKMLVAAALAGAIVMALCLFVMHFRMNGVIVSDCIYWPLTVAATGLLAVWLLWDIAAGNGSAGVGLTLVEVPLVQASPFSPLASLGFVLNLLVVNFAILTVRDEHWIRVAAFSEQDRPERNLMLDRLPGACLSAAALWLAIIVIGSVLFPLHPNASAGDGEWYAVLLRMGESAPALFSLLVMGICAVALSTMDSQFFAFRQLASYRSRSDAVAVAGRSLARRVLMALGFGALTFMVVYLALVTGYDDFLVVLMLYPLPVVLLPGLLKLSLVGSAPTLRDVLVPLLVYLVLAGAVLWQSAAHGDAPMTLLFWVAPLATAAGALHCLLPRVAGRARTIAGGQGT